MSKEFPAMVAAAVAGTLIALFIAHRVSVSFHDAKRRQADAAQPHH